MIFACMMLRIEPALSWEQTVIQSRAVFARRGIFAFACA
jgi:hypothetical protein